MPLVWLHFPCFLPSLIVKVEHKFLVLMPSFRRSDIFNPKAFPQSIGIAESWYTTFCTDARTGKDNEFFHGYELRRRPPYYNARTLLYGDCFSRTSSLRSETPSQ